MSEDHSNHTVRTTQAELDKLSPTMREAYEFAMKNGGKLYRHPGGFWAGKEWVPHQVPWFGVQTVEALVKRGVAVFSDWRYNRGRSDRYVRNGWPVEATMIL